MASWSNCRFQCHERWPHGQIAASSVMRIVSWSNCRFQRHERWPHGQTAASSVMRDGLMVKLPLPAS
ncbi:hypothetical protein RRG08_062367 [Elysia crispata]|uniref:Uncharacterized protein n=1 Tax=Elysia crispata TaxID=231223 RepID=A0AAE0YGR1_9GAST|nr:hypothetical protein RRG08_062367 [Elysia crispata]